MKEPTQGLGRARNTGVRHARGTVVLFVDDDVEVPPHWVDTLSRPLLAQECDLVAGTIRPGPGRDQPWMGPFLASSLLLEPMDGRPSHLIGASFGCHRRVLEAISFDPELGAGSEHGSAEDVFFYEQAKQAGFVTLGCTGAPALHHFDLGRMSHAALSRAAGAVGRSQAYIAHHWLHSKLRFLRVRQEVDRLRLLTAHGRRRSEPGMSDEEFRRRIALAFKQQLAIEQARPHNYALRGLTRLRDVDA